MKTVFITGSSSGIGRDTALFFIQKGWNVAATMRNPVPYENISSSANVKYYTLDVTKKDTMEKAWNQAIEDFGEIDVLINNAGFGLLGPFEAVSREQLERQFNTNVFGLMEMIQTALPHFRAKKKGTIVNISSVGGRVTFPLFSLYHSTKWAVEGFVESLHFELRPMGIRVRLIEPGSIRTDFYSRSKTILSKEGLTAYDAYASTVLTNFNNVEQYAESSKSVVKAIYAASLSTSFSKIRYTVGGGAPMMLFFRRLLPYSVMFALIRLVVEGNWFKKKKEI